jgi:hypothetical protein
VIGVLFVAFLVILVIILFLRNRKHKFNKRIDLVSKEMNKDSWNDNKLQKNGNGRNWKEFEQK